LVHLMECHCDFRRQILNGEKWNHVTTLTPVGLGPWESWKCSTIAAMNHTTIPIPLTWTTARILDRLERWNGLGYRQRGIASPYLWSGSNHGVGVGKFISDGKYDRHAVSAQVGAALVLREIW
jgi:lysozyme family protein